MPAAHDVYAEQLGELRRGHALYHPEPRPEGPVEIGDVGYTKHGTFFRLFNASRFPDDPVQRFGVPDAFVPLDIGVVDTYEAALEPGPLYSRAISTLSAETGQSSDILPGEARFRFGCSPKRGAILMLETRMIHQETAPSPRVENYLIQNSHSWHAFARSLDIHLAFGDLMLVTGCSKTAAWSTAVYSNSSTDFNLSFSIEMPFTTDGIAAPNGFEQIEPLERRSSLPRIQAHDSSLPKNHTVFIKAYRLGMRQSYHHSLVFLFMKARGSIFYKNGGNGEGASEAALQSALPASQNSSSTDSTEPYVMRPYEPDFHSSIALLGLALAISDDSECVVVHDNTWCSASPDSETSRIMKQYADFHFSNEVESMLNATSGKTTFSHPSHQPYALTTPTSSTKETSIPSPILQPSSSSLAPDSHKSNDAGLGNSSSIPKSEVPPIISRLTSIFHDTAQYRSIMKCKGDDAQRLLDMFQSLLHSPGLESGFRRNLVVAVQRLSRGSNLYPTSFTLDNVQLIGEDPVMAGSFGDLYHGKLEGQSVCLKVVRIYQSSMVDHLLKVFSREAILWGQLSHPNLLPFLGVYRFRSRMCLVSPWMENGTITNYLHHNPGANRVLLASDIAAGLSYLHENDVIHGDLRGSNVLITGGGCACLADFGLSSISDTEILIWTSHSSASSKGGSARWQAPELLTMDEEVPYNTKRSDVYAMACAFYEIFTDSPPFSEIRADALVMFKVHSGKRPSRPTPSSPAWTVWGLTEDIWALIERCWTQDPVVRPIAEDVVLYLERIKPEDQRPVESIDISSFRNSLSGEVEAYKLADLEALINGRA